VNGLLQRHAVVGILDEIQRRPDLYRALRVLVDRPAFLSMTWTCANRTFSGAAVVFRARSSRARTATAWNGGASSSGRSWSATFRSWVSGWPPAPCAGSGSCWRTTTARPGTARSSRGLSAWPTQPSGTTWMCSLQPWCSTCPGKLTLRGTPSQAPPGRDSSASGGDSRSSAPHPPA